MPPDPGRCKRTRPVRRRSFLDIAVDVFDHEPATADDPLVSSEDALCTPHLGYVTRESYELYFGQAFAQVNAFAAKQALS